MKKYDPTDVIGEDNSLLMRYEVFDEHTTSPELAIVMPNHLAGTLNGTNGNRAYHLNDATGLTVVAFERRNTGSLPRDRVFDVKTYKADAAERAKKLQGILEALGFEQAVITHDSAGALDSLALAASGEIQVAKVIPIEPICLIPIENTKDAFKEWLKAAFQGEKGKNLAEFSSLEDLEVKRPKPSHARDIMRQLKEFEGYRNVYSTATARDLLVNLRDKDVPVDLVLAGNTFTASPDVQDKITEDLAGSSVNVTIYDKAHHNFIEPAVNFVYVVKKVLEADPIKP
jgi:pimeloyl-ACP methyl ester carboxylesterase